MKQLHTVEAAPEILIPYLVAPAPWWDSPLWSGLLGAIVGGTISAVVSFVLAWQAGRETLRRDADQRKAQELALQRIGVIKTKSIVDALIEAGRTIVEMLEFAKAQGFEKFDLWQKVQPIIGAHPPYRFDPAELGLFHTIDSHLGHELSLLEAKVAADLNALEIYGRRRLELTDGLPAKVEGDTLRFTRLTEEQAAFIEPRAAELNKLILDLMDGIATDLEYGLKVGPTIGPKSASYFKLKTAPGVEFPTAAEIAIKLRAHLAR
jgi:hypothetical protein